MPVRFISVKTQRQPVLGWKPADSLPRCNSKSPIPASADFRPRGMVPRLFSPAGEDLAQVIGPTSGSQPSSLLLQLLNPNFGDQRWIRAFETTEALRTSEGTEISINDGWRSARKALKKSSPAGMAPGFIHIFRASSQRGGSSKPGTQCRTGVSGNPRVLKGRLMREWCR